MVFYSSHIPDLFLTSVRQLCIVNLFPSVLQCVMYSVSWLRLITLVICKNIKINIRGILVWLRLITTLGCLSWFLNWNCDRITPVNQCGLLFYVFPWSGGPLLVVWLSSGWSSTNLHVSYMVPTKVQWGPVQTIITYVTLLFHAKQTERVDRRTLKLEVQCSIKTFKWKLFELFCHVRGKYCRINWCLSTAENS